MQLFFSCFFVLGLMLIATPFTPLFAYSVFPPNVEKETAKAFTTNASVLPVFNTLVIPKINVDIPILEGDESVLEKGAWRIPQTSNNPTQGNMVVSAHRFRYRPPATTTFYLLDKLKAGDAIVLHWNGVAYRYRVTKSTVVAATAVSILHPTETPTLTLFTCHPLFSTKQRLVITANPV